METSSTNRTSAPSVSWISWICSLQGNHFLCEVDRSFITDGFNLCGLKSYAPDNFLRALDIILDKLDQSENGVNDIFRPAELLYGLIHARYILTASGLLAMSQKWANKAFGECPRYHCSLQPLLPVGLNDEPGLSAVKVYCPRCRDIYQPPSSVAHLDGAYFGTSFPMFFLLTFPNLAPMQQSSPSLRYEARVFGFRVHRSSAVFQNDNAEHLRTFLSSTDPDEGERKGGTGKARKRARPAQQIDWTAAAVAIPEAS